MVVPPCPGLVAAAPPRPSQVKGEAGAGDEPGGVLPGEAVQAGSLGDSQPDGGDAGRAWLAAAGGDGRIPAGDLQVSVADVVIVIVIVIAAGAGLAASPRERAGG